MKSQKTKEVIEKKVPVGMATQFETATAPNKDARPARTPFGDLHAHIAKRAYELHLERDCREGGALEDWLTAERELLGRGSV